MSRTLDDLKGRPIVSHRFIFEDNCEYDAWTWCRLCGQFDNADNPTIPDHQEAKRELDRVLAERVARVRIAVGGKPSRLLAVGA